MQGNYTYPNRPAIKDIDYKMLAAMAQTGRISFEVLCKRAEEGKPLSEEKTVDPDWVDYHEAAAILGATYLSLTGSFTDPSAVIDYFGIHWQSKSKTLSKGKRGCGVLFYRADLIVIRNIKQAGFQLRTALRIFQAMERGLI